MPDSNTTQPNNDDVSQKKALSPWDEELPPPEPKKNLVVGSLDSANSKDINIDQDKKPVPFNIPANINEEKVGKKIPAEEIIKKQPEVSSSLPPNLASPPVAKPKPSLISTMKPESKTTEPLAQPQVPALTKAKEVVIQPKPDQIPLKPIQPPPAAKPKPEPIPAPPIQAPPAQVKFVPIQVKPESGVGELVQPAGSQAQAEAQKAVEPEPLPLKVPPAIAQEKAGVVQMSPFGRDKIEPKSKEEPKPVLPDITPRADRFKTEKNLDSISNIQIQPEPRNVKPEKPDIFAGEKAKIPKVEEKKKEPAPAPIRKPVESNKPSFFKRPGFIIVASVLFLLTAGIYLTEMGLMSVGLEKVYGIFGLESLWGGLPRNAEKALGKSAVAMRDQLNFKIKGSITLTVNKTIKSPITTPLVSVATSPYALRDENISEGIKAVLTQYDYYNSSSSPDSSTGSSSSSSSTTPSVTGTTPPSSTSPGSQQDAASYQPEESTIKQIDAEFEGESSDDAIKNEIKIKKLVGSDSTLSIISNKKDLYVKSSPDIKYASNADSSKWLDFNISNISENNPVKDFTNIKLDKGFSIIGRRSGNEKIGSVRCFKYTLDNLEIGDSLDYLGIKSDSVSKISGDVWIGVVDHYIHKIDVKITPSIASSISQISLTFELYDYGVENSIVIPALSDKIVAESGGTATDTTATTLSDQGDMYSRDKTRKSDLITIKTALEKYKQTNGSYPKAPEMVKLNTKDNIIQTSLVPEFIASIPTDPKAAEGWYYGYKSDGNKFTLSARLENSDDPQVTRVGEAYVHWVYNN